MSVINPFYVIPACGVAIVLSIAAAATAYGHDATGLYTSWMATQHNMAGFMCCDGTDALIVNDGDWRASREYEVRVGGAWYPVPDTSLLDPKGGPNPTGKALLWLHAGHIQCFGPATEG